MLCDCGRGACCVPSVTCRETSSVLSDVSNRVLFSVGWECNFSSNNSNPSRSKDAAADLLS